MPDLLWIAIIAGLLALDDRAGWQSLLGEPVFSSLLVGLATGHVATALRCGVALQLVWLSIGAARGSRRPNVVVGGVVGAGAACLALDRTGDPREPVLIAAAVFCGLVAGEAGQWLSGTAGRLRERWLDGFRLPTEANVASRNLVIYTVGSALAVALVDALVVLAALPVAVAVTEFIMDRIGPAAPGASQWLMALPALAIATIVHAFAARSLGRFAALGALIAVVTVWLL